MNRLFEKTLGGFVRTPSWWRDTPQESKQGIKLLSGFWILQIPLIYVLYARPPSSKQQIPILQGEPSDLTPQQRPTPAAAFRLG